MFVELNPLKVPVPDSQLLSRSFCIKFIKQARSLGGFLKFVMCLLDVQMEYFGSSLLSHSLCQSFAPPNSV